MTTEELKAILANHSRWLRGENSGCANLRGANLRNANLRDANLYGADLCVANLRGANLRNANLYGADLRDADLRDADLRDADLRDADLYGADLRGANLRGTNLRNADLAGADLAGADLRGANGIASIGPMGSRDDMLYVVAHEHTRMYHAGCFWGTEEEFLSAVAEKHGDNQYGRTYRAAVELARVLLPAAALEAGEVGQ